MAPQAFLTSTPNFDYKSSFTIPPVCEVPAYQIQSPDRRAQWRMAKVSKFGPFTPAVFVAKIAIGEKNLNKLRGKGIALHSQAITAFCEFTGAGPKMRQALIRTAKANGNKLGFLS